MKDQYKADVITEELGKMDSDGYYLVRLKGDIGKALNVERPVLMLMRAYYEGKLSDDEIEAICRA